ncbi:MFS transporter [Xylanimonas oleitrophica]|uniref:MFS transporter n=1 Tax=Xylanimonas oleitrophica TaxID=2607479 RepID=A0A2W5WRV5_9MICO|nr:MFS transporter [Xylanimonas oleitrophica]PZR54239.1 MFS transporter [Xylanimonas oleitrophica]
MNPGRTGRARWFLLAALLLVALNLRAPLTSLPPVVGQVSDALALTPAQAGLLTSVPVLCFALLTPPAALLLARLGPERSVLVAVVGVLAGELLRSAGSVPAALAGTAVLGAGITVGNVAVPVVIARDFRDRSAAVTGAYSATMNLGSALTTTLTVPLAAVWGWQWALAGWGVLAVVATAAWGGAMRSTAPAARLDGAQHGSGAPHLGRPMAVLTAVLCVAFSGQAFAYYAITAWLPEILHSRLGLDLAAAGGAAAPFQLCAVAGSFAVPLALSRRVPARAVSAVVSLCWLSLPTGMLLAPGATGLWVALAGAAQGGSFTLIFTLMAQRAPSVAAARRASAIVQTTGYACASLAPTVLGAVHTASTGPGSDGWTAPLLLVLGVLTVMGGMMLVATRPVRG